MRNLADAIEAGKVQFLDGVRTKTQLTQLLQALGSAKVQQLMASMALGLQSKRASMRPWMPKRWTLPSSPLHMYRSDLAALGGNCRKLTAARRWARLMACLADDVTDAYTDWAKDEFAAGEPLRQQDQGRLCRLRQQGSAERAIKRSGLWAKPWSCNQARAEPGDSVAR
jgi:hypothetical protein